MEGKREEKKNTDWRVFSQRTIKVTEHVTLTNVSP